MRFEFTAEQIELRAVLRQFLTDKCSEAVVRRNMATDDGFDAELWQLAARELGLPGLAIPEAYGGSGASFLELAIALQELGRSLDGSPLFASAVLAASLLLALADEAARTDYLPGIAAGETIATVALAEGSGRWDEPSVQLPAANDDGRWRLTGEKLYVPDGLVADLILVAARTPAGISVFALEPRAAGVVVEPLTTLDQTRRLVRIRLENAIGRLIGTDGQAWPAIATMLDQAAAGLAAEQVGGAERVLEMAVDHAKSRYQFGRPIGGFQAIKHRCADLHVEVELAKSAAYAASWAVAENADDLPAIAAAAQAYCAETYLRAASENIQIHGGMGFTWEHPAHLYFKRAVSSAVMFGDASYHRGLFARQLGF